MTGPRLMNKSVFVPKGLLWSTTRSLSSVKSKGSPQCRIVGTSSLTVVPYDLRGKGFVLCKCL